MVDFKKIINFIREIYNTEEYIPLHVPVFNGNEKRYLNECIDSTFVSSVGKFVDQFEMDVQKFTGAKKAVAVVNGTSALHAALHLVGVKPGNEVITQPLTFIATCNAISYCGASPVFVDVDIDTMGMSPYSLRKFLEDNCKKENSDIVNQKTGRIVSACVPMHTFGHPVRIEEIKEICDEWGLSLVEDAAESIGSYSGEIHTGLFGRCGILSFNGNKTITTGGGGMIITNDESFGHLAKHITTTAKIPHRWEFRHDMIGFNYRMPNINAALGCAQVECLPEMIKTKREIALKYKTFFDSERIDFITEREGTKSNYWLNAIKFKTKEEREAFLEYSNSNGVMTRPVWTLMNELDIYKTKPLNDSINSKILEDCLVNIPSSCI